MNNRRIVSDTAATPAWTSKPGPSTGQCRRTALALGRIPLYCALILLLALPAMAKPRASKVEQPSGPGAPTTFAPLPEGHELASIWNDPVFARRLIGSYGFASDFEPRMSPEEQITYREKVVPLVREDQKKAIALLHELVKPSASAVLDFTLGNLYFQNGDLTNAVKHFEAALGKFPDYRRAQKNLGFALVRSGNYKDAIKPLGRAIALGAGDSRVYGLLGFAYMSGGSYASAEAAYNEALLLDPENADFKLGSVKCAVATANYDHALALLDELIEAHPEQDNLWTLQANIYIQKEQTAKAALSLEMIRRLGKATAANLYLLGDLYMAQEARGLALVAYTEAIDKDAGQNPAKALHPAEILVSRGAWDEARKLFGKIRSAGVLSAPDELKLLKLESKVAMSTGSGEEAIKVLEQIIERNPLDGEALLLAGEYYAQNGQPEKAQYRFQTAGKIAGFEADANVREAQLLVRQQKYTQAVELLRKAQKLRPRENVQRYLEKVELAARSGRS